MPETENMRIVRLLPMFVFILWGVAFYTEDCYSHVSDNRALEYATSVPRRYENDVNSLTRYLIQPYKDQYDQAKSIAYWIASHIVYDRYIYDGVERTRIGKKYHGQRAEDLILSRTGVCGDFAELFHVMTDIAGIESKVIHGRIRENGREEYKKGYHIPRRGHNSSHAWNSFRYNGKDIYVDTTWMADGKMYVNYRVSESEHKRSLKRLKKDNERSSRVYPVNSYYFDFTYHKYNRNSYLENPDREFAGWED